MSQQSGNPAPTLQLRPSSPSASGEARTDTAALQSLAATWQAETAHLSSVHQMVLHPAYQRIIGFGKVALPFLLQQLQKQPNHWFWALRAVTGVDPIAEEDRGDVQAMTEAWLRWGRDHRYA